MYTYGICIYLITRVYIKYLFILFLYVLWEKPSAILNYLVTFNVNVYFLVCV